MCIYGVWLVSVLEVEDVAQKREVRYTAGLDENGTLLGLNLVGPSSSRWIV